MSRFLCQRNPAAAAARCVMINCRGFICFFVFPTPVHPVGGSPGTSETSDRWRVRAQPASSQRERITNMTSEPSSNCNNKNDGSVPPPSKRFISLAKHYESHIFLCRLSVEAAAAAAAESLHLPFSARSKSANYTAPNVAGIVFKLAAQV